MEREKQKSNSTVDNSHLSQVIRSTSTVISHVIVYGLDIMWPKNGTLLLWPSFQRPLTQPNHEKKTRKIQMEEYSTTYLTNVPPNCQGHLKHRGLRNCQSQEESKEEMMTEYNAFNG